MDQFDTGSAVYLIGVEDQKVITGSRLVPTNEPHMLSEIFPHLCTLEGGVIRDPRVAEWTRGFVVPEYREGLGVRLKAQFCYSVMEYCLGEGITRIGGIQDIFWLALWQRFGWKVSIHGAPVDFGSGRPWVPAYFDVSVAALVGARRWAKIDRSLLVKDGPQRRFAPGRYRSHGPRRAVAISRPVLVH
jgi:acyl-homoserine lactone synthase